jgi:hypothetical protein
MIINNVYLTEVNTQRLSLEAITSLQGNSVVFLGTGFDCKLGDELTKKGYKILCNDILSIDKCNSPKIIENARKLDYDYLKRNYSTLVSERLCEFGNANITLDLLPVWNGFKNIIIEFCNNKNHYNIAHQKYSIEPVMYAKISEEYFHKKNYQTIIIKNDSQSNETTNIILIASKNKIPSIEKLFPKNSRTIFDFY